MIGTMLQRARTWAEALTEERLRLYPAAALTAVVVAFALSIGFSDGTGTLAGRLGGDYPAFYSAGSLVADGKADLLFHDGAAVSRQRELHDNGDDRYLAFAYPPHVALLYAPLSLLPYKWSYALHTVLMAAALALSAWLIAPLLPVLGRYPFAMFVALLVFYPLFRSTFGGQNTGLTLLLLAIAWRAAAEDRPTLLGLALSLLLFKPQFAIPVIALLGPRARRRFWLTLGAGAGIVYALCVSVGGWDWLGWWLDAAGRFHAMDQGVNSANSIGFLGVLEALLGVGHTGAVAFGLALSVAVCALLAVIWWFVRVPVDIGMAAIFTALPLVQPHAMYYDGGLALLSLFILYSRRLVTPALVVVLFAAAYVTPLSAVTGVSPMFVVLVATLILVLHGVVVERRRTATGHTELLD